MSHSVGFPFGIPNNPYTSAALGHGQASQVGGIKGGLEDGSISMNEAKGLLKLQADLSKTIQKAQADGWMSPEELGTIGQKMGAAHMAIEQAKQGGETGNPLDPATQAQAGQLGEISRGLASGSLTAGEAGGLLDGQAKNSGRASSLTAAQGAAGMDLMEQLSDGERGLKGKRSREASNAAADQVDGIKNGLASGALSQREAKGLLEMQSDISEARAAFEADGKLSKGESKILKQMQKAASAALGEALTNSEKGNPIAAGPQLAQLDMLADGMRNRSVSAAEASSLLEGQSAISGMSAKLQSSQAAAPGQIAMQQHDGEVAMHHPSNFISM